MQPAFAGKERIYVSVDMTADRSDLETAQADLNRFVSQVSKDIKQDVVIRVDIEAVDMHRFTARVDRR